MTPLDGCRQALDEAGARLAAPLPPGGAGRAGGAAALLALLRAGDTVPLADDPAQAAAPPVARPGWNLALRLCLERPDGEDGAGAAGEETLAAWAERFLAECDQLALAGLALAQCASGHLHLQQRAPRTFVAWAAHQRLSAEQRERAGFDWWSAHLAQQAAPRLAVLRAEREPVVALLGRESAAGPAPVGIFRSEPAVDGYYRRLGQAHLARCACQHSYPEDAAIGGATFHRYAGILALLIGWLQRERDRRAAQDDLAPVALEERALAAALDADPAAIGHALQPFILDRDNAAYHGGFTGGVAPPLIRLDEGRVVWSARGLLSAPLLFLARELRRRHAQEYHNSAHLREGVFRQDLYRLFAGGRYALSAGRVELRGSGGARTDLDALVFDRKSGTLGVFELKAQDPFARSVEERQRQRDNFLQANRQVSAILEWAQRHGADDLLARFDERTAKRFHVQKVCVFVLGRYLAHFDGGPQPDRRAAWASWPEVLQLVGDGPLDPEQRNPLASLFARLRAAPPPSAPAGAAVQEIAVGDLHLRVFPSFAAMRAEEDRPA